jgi:EAL domain-containing protein (putative c-di-GMP-specific phosphodiesterase class I)
MENTYYAILIGINEYVDEQLPKLNWAEKDCSDLYNALTNNEHGMFPPDHVSLLLGKNATLENIQQKLFAQVVHNRTKNDTVLVYISGHAFPIPYQNRVYLATQETEIESVKQNPLKGLWMYQLHDEFFKKSDVKNLIFILDTCYSGSLIPQSTKGTGKIQLIDETFYTTGTGKIAIVSSPPQGPSREDDCFKNGVFSHFLIRGLLGEAADEENGEVTIDSLLTYIRREVPPEQPTGRYGQDYGRIVLSKSFIIQKEREYSKSYPEFEISKDSLYKSNFSSLGNILEPYQEIIKNLVNLLSEGCQNKVGVDNHILNTIRLSSGAKAAFLLRKDLNTWIVKSISNTFDTPSSIDSYVSTALSASLRNGALGPDIRGVFGKMPIGSSEISLYTISLRKTYPFEMLVVCEPNNDLVQTDVYAEIIIGLYNITNSFSAMPNNLVIESAIYDHLRVMYKFVPITFYNHRYKLYTDRLHNKNISVLFQPIFKFGVNEISISGFEALAHDTDAEKSPADIFRAAELWGKKFMLEADLHFLQIALNKYKEVRLKTPGYRRPEDIQDLSINVYPESLIRSKYHNEMRNLITSGLIPNDKLYLELSEKTIFPKVEGEGIAAQTDISSFRQILEEYVHSFGIGFAIDDFGIGYSSISRLAELHPSYLKIDREILLLDDAYNTIKFIISFVNDLTSKQFLRNAKIVLEGYDNETSRFVELRKLKKIGVQYVQGYVIGKPVHDKLMRLEGSSKDYLFSLMNSTNNETRSV